MDLLDLGVGQEVAEREIVNAAEAMLREKPFRDLTVDDLMRRTGLSRPSFYVYNDTDDIDALADAMDAAGQFFSF